MTQTIPCHDAVRRLWDYLDGGLQATERDRVEAHLSFCLRCCGELEFARELRGLLRVRTAATMPDQTLERLQSFIDHLEPPATHDHDDE